MHYQALSIVAPGGDWIRSGKKTLEIRQWHPGTVPLRDLLIIQNKIKLGSEGLQNDPEGEAVALVDMESVASWKQTEIEEACASYWEPGWLAWKLVNVRPLHSSHKFPARLRIYELEAPDPLLQQED